MRANRSKAVLGVIAFAVALVATACGSGDEENEPDTVAVGGGYATIGDASGFQRPADAKTYVFVRGSEAPDADPIAANESVARRFGWWGIEGIDLQYVTAKDVTSGVRSGQADSAGISPQELLSILYQDPDADLTSFYNDLPQNHGRVVVMPDSPISAVKDLVGKTVGTYSATGSAYANLRTELEYLGYTPDKDVKFVVVPPGAAIANALESGDVDAFVYYDTLNLATERLLGVELKVIPREEIFEHAAGSVVLTRKSDLADNTRKYVGFIKGQLKGWAFVNGNPEAAACIHLQEFPENQEPGESKEDALARMVTAINARQETSQVVPWQPEPKLFGFNFPESYEVYKEILDLPDDFDVTTAFDNRAIEQAHKELDLDAVEEFARGYDAGC